jgi:hypothetical protein
MMIDYSYGADGLSREDMLANMKVGWKHSVHICGSGSTHHSAQISAQTIRQLRGKYDIGTVANVGAGHLQWWRHYHLQEADHYDLVPREEGIKQFDCTAQVLPQAYDMIVCRWVLNHLSARLAYEALCNFVASESTYLLMTHKDKPFRPGKQTCAGYWREHGLEMPEPLESTRDWEGWDFNLYSLTDVVESLKLASLHFPDKE